MPTYAVKRLIAADPQTIWNLLTDASTMPPGILRYWGSKGRSLLASGSN
jgi:uncharacterized protein YndB with AHSA1/START domain